MHFPDVRWFSLQIDNARPPSATRFGCATFYPQTLSLCDSVGVGVEGMECLAMNGKEEKAHPWCRKHQLDPD